MALWTVRGTCQQHSDVVHEGESAAWNSIYFNTYETHELDGYTRGQDEIDVLIPSSPTKHRLDRITHGSERH